MSEGVTNTRHGFITLELGKGMIFVTLRHKLPSQIRKFEKLNRLSAVLVILFLADLWPIQKTEGVTNTNNGFSTLELGKRIIFVTLGHKMPSKMRKCEIFNSLVSAFLIGRFMADTGVKEGDEHQKWIQHPRIR
jgi:hypothetical protein